MSLQTWKAEFYPVSAQSDVARADPVAHSLRKWRGLTPENLARHGVWRVGSCAIGDDTVTMAIDETTCSLCVWYGEHDELCRYSCRLCTLYATRGCFCYMPRADEGLSPWRAWTHNGDPLPMIQALEAAQEMERGANGRAT